MAIDKFEYLPGIISEIQDGGLQITEENASPAVLILGTAEKGIAGTPYKVRRTQDAEYKFGKAGTLVRGMYETLAGDAGNVYLMRIGAKSAILYGVGTDNQEVNPTSIETLLKDKDASSVYFVKYTSPEDLGPNAEVGRLQIKNALDEIVFDNNPGGIAIDSGEVIVDGDFEGGKTIPAFTAFNLLAKDEEALTETFDAESPALASYTLTKTNARKGVVLVDNKEVLASDVTVSNGVVSFADPSIAENKEVVISYVYDADTSINLRDGSDGTNLSRMEMYEALEEAYRSIETDTFQIIIPMDVYLDDSNSADGATIVLSSSLLKKEGQRYPVMGTKGDALGKAFVEESDGEFFYFWDVNGDGKAEIYPKIGLASVTTKINGEALVASDFSEVNFGHQLAYTCFVASAHEYNVSGVIGVKMPKSFSPKDINKWIGKEPIYDQVGKVLVNGTGLCGNKILAGNKTRSAGLFATNSGKMATSLIGNGDVLKDRGGIAVDIGRYLSVYVMPQRFFNPSDETGAGYIACGYTYYGGFYSMLPSNSAPTNKIASAALAPFKLSKTKINSLAKFSMVALKEKDGVFRFSDAPTAALSSSDFKRLSTCRVVAEAIDIVRSVATPYLGEAGTPQALVSMETNMRKELGKAQTLGRWINFQVKVHASIKERIEGSANVELTIVPANELRKITVITSLAKQ